MKTLKTALVAAAVMAFTVALGAGNTAASSSVKENYSDTTPKKDTTKKKDTSAVEFRLR